MQGLQLIEYMKSYGMADILTHEVKSKRNPFGASTKRNCDCDGEHFFFPKTYCGLLFSIPGREPKYKEYCFRHLWEVYLTDFPIEIPEGPAP